MSKGGGGDSSGTNNLIQQQIDQTNRQRIEQTQSAWSKELAAFRSMHGASYTPDITNKSQGTTS